MQNRPETLIQFHRHRMDSNKTTLERAFELARSGNCADLKELVKTLEKEGYDGSYIRGKSLRQQLLKLIRSPRDPA